MSADSDFPSAASEPTRELLLAQALETCIRAERQVPGSADQIIAHQPAWARAELRRLVALAGSLHAAATSAVMSDEFRAAARARLMRRITAQPDHAAPPAVGQNGRAPIPGGWLSSIPGPGATVSRNGHHRVWRPRRRVGWLWRGGAGGLLAAALVLGATLTASASALPGEPLYSVKQAREEIGYRLAPDDQARTLVLLGQADARLDETARLLQLGRTQYVAETTQRFDDVLGRATTTYVVTIAEAPRSDPTTQTLENKLNEQQQEIQMLLAVAPEPTQADLREALVATQRSRAMVADPHTSAPTASAPQAPVAASTAAPVPTPTTAPRLVAPPPVDLLPQKPPKPTPVVAVEQHDANEIGVERAVGGAGAVTGGGSGRSDLNGGSGNGRQGRDRPDDAQVATDDDRAQDGGDDAHTGRVEGSSQASQGQATRVVVVPRSNASSVAEAHAQHDDGDEDDVAAPAQVSNRAQGGGDQRPSDDGSNRVVAPAQNQNQNDGRDRVAQQAIPTAVVARQASDGRSGGGDGRSSSASTPAEVVAQPASATPRTFSSSGSSNVARQPSPTSTPSSTVRALGSPVPTTGDGRRTSEDSNNTTSRFSGQSSGSGGDRSNSGGDDDGGHGH
jgi:Domain of unknown function (DUF5667)